MPKLSNEIRKKIRKDIRLTLGSLLKLVSKSRTDYIHFIKPALETVDYIIRDVDNMLIFAKNIKDKEYFTSIILETKEYFISISNAPKKINILRNKIKNGAEVIYQSSNSESITYTPELLQASQSSANKTDKRNPSTNNAKSQYKPS